MYKQEKPFSIQIELTEGCNRGCGFCGLRGMREKGKEPYYFMTKTTATRIADQIVEADWNSRLIFSMHGEPTLNKNCLNIIKMFRKRLPKAVISIMTNGYGLGNDTFSIDDFKQAGVNDLIIDMYTPGDDGHQILEAIDSDKLTLPEGSKHEILGPGIPLYGSSSKKFRVLFNLPIQLEEGAAINRHLCNHCGAAAPLDMSYDGKRCARPFRELSFRYDGSVAICCNDFRGQYPIGNIMKMTIEEIWHNKRFKAARAMLYHGKRTFVPCYGCNALSHRVGLLPDHTGKESIDEPKAGGEIEKYAKSIALTNEPLCGENFKKRKWDK